MFKIRESKGAMITSYNKQLSCYEILIDVTKSIRLSYFTFVNKDGSRSVFFPDGTYLKKGRLRKFAPESSSL